MLLATNNTFTATSPSCFEAYINGISSVEPRDLEDNAYEPATAEDDGFQLLTSQGTAFLPTEAALTIVDLGKTTSNASPLINALDTMSFKGPVISYTPVSPLGQTDHTSPAPSTLEETSWNSRLPKTPSFTLSRPVISRTASQATTALSLELPNPVRLQIPYHVPHHLSSTRILCHSKMAPRILTALLGTSKAPPFRRLLLPPKQL